MTKWSILFFGAVMLLVSGCATVSDTAATERGSFSDHDIESAVSYRLQMEHMTARESIGVSSRNGEVTLSGIVGDTMVKIQAIAVTRGTPGVSRVIDRIRVY